MKIELGLPRYDAPNAVEELKNTRKHLTPEKVEAIKAALINICPPNRFWIHTELQYSLTKITSCVCSVRIKKHFTRVNLWGKRIH